jgi:hypothetical protein
MLRDAGVRDVGVRYTSRLTHAGDDYHTFLLALLRTPLLADQGRNLRDGQMPWRCRTSRAAVSSVLIP